MEHVLNALAVHGPCQLISYCRENVWSWSKAKWEACIIKILSFHDIPNSHRSCWCTGTMLYAQLKTSFANSVPTPRALTISTAWSMEAYCMEHMTDGIPSLTLWPSGEERSTIRRHFPSWCGLGIMPIGLQCTPSMPKWAIDSAQMGFNLQIFWHSIFIAL